MSYAQTFKYIEGFDHIRNMSQKWIFQDLCFTSFVGWDTGNALFTTVELPPRPGRALDLGSAPANTKLRLDLKTYTPTLAFGFEIIREKVTDMKMTFSTATSATAATDLFTIEFQTDGSIKITGETEHISAAGILPYDDAAFMELSIRLSSYSGSLGADGIVTVIVNGSEIYSVTNAKIGNAALDFREIDLMSFQTTSGGIWLDNLYTGTALITGPTGANAPVTTFTVGTIYPTGTYYENFDGERSTCAPGALDAWQGISEKLLVDGTIFTGTTTGLPWTILFWYGPSVPTAIDQDALQYFFSQTACRLLVNSTGVHARFGFDLDTGTQLFRTVQPPVGAFRTYTIGSQGSGPRTTFGVQSQTEAGEITCSQQVLEVGYQAKPRASTTHLITIC